MFKDVNINIKGERTSGAPQQTRLRSFRPFTEQRFKNRVYHCEGGVSFSSQARDFNELIEITCDVNICEYLYQW